MNKPKIISQVKDPKEIAAAWKAYLNTVADWRELVKDITPKPTGCGPVYELPNPIDRTNESFAIADMRKLSYAEPHYHTNNETEIYIVLSGSGVVVIGGKENNVQPGSVCIIYPETAHFTVPADDLVLAVINTPPFSAQNVVNVDEHVSRPEVGYDAEQLAALTSVR